VEEEMTEKRTFGPNDPFPEDGTYEEFVQWHEAMAREGMRRRIQEWPEDCGMTGTLEEVLAETERRRRTFVIIEGDPSK
jgi:hypothetical protein